MNTVKRKPFISLTAKMTPRHKELIHLFDGLLYSGDRMKKGLIIFNSEHAQAEYQLTVEDANDLRKLIEAECALEAIRADDNIKHWHNILAALGAQPEEKKSGVNLKEFNDIVTTAMAVAQGANHMCADHPTTAKRQKRILVGAVVAYVMNRFDIKRV